MLPKVTSPMFRRGRAAIAAVSAVSAVLVWASPAIAAPYRPVDGATVIHVVPPAVVASRARARSLDARLEADRADLSAAVELARLAIREGRASADPRLYGRAQAALDPWWRDPSAPPEVRVLRAVIRQASHDFAAALSDLDSVLETSPTDGQARLTRAFVLQAIGALDRAAADCRALPRAIGPLAGAACLARVSALTGKGEQALESLVRIMALDRRADPTMRRFASGIAAEIAAALGRDEEAEGLLAGAVAGETDLPSLLAYADFLIDVERPTEVLTLLADHSNVDAALLRLAIAAEAVGDPRAADWTSLLAERFAVARAGNGPLHVGEEARFELELRSDPRRALALALANWVIEKEPRNARLVLEAALAADRPDAARDVVSFLAATGLVDRRLERLRDRLAMRIANLGPRPLDRLPEAR
jgi:hypothetical protein